MALTSAAATDVMLSVRSRDHLDCQCKPILDTSIYFMRENIDEISKEKLWS